MLGTLPGITVIIESWTIERVFDGFTPIYYSDLESILYHIQPSWIAKAVIVCLICYYVVIKAHIKISQKTLIRIGIFVVFCLASDFFFHIAISNKYKRNMY